MRVAEIVAQYLSEVNPDACFIDGGGPGGPLCDRLMDLGYPVHEIGFGGHAAQSSRFANKKMEMSWRYREWLEKGGAIPKDPRLLKEMTLCQVDTDRLDRWILESKESLRARGEESPDWFDSHILTFAHTVVKSEMTSLGAHTQRYATNSFDVWSE
jgi:hypothetical protein